MGDYVIYCQKVDKNFVDDFVFNAYLGFRQMGFDVKTFEDIDQVPLNRKNVVVSYIEDTEKYLTNLGIPVPYPINIPESLDQYLMRKVNRLTMGDFKNNPTTPIFIKPLDKLKQFPAGVIKEKSSVNILFHDVSDETRILTSQVEVYVSEYRGFVLKGELIGLKHYIGDFTVFPDIGVIKRFISLYQMLEQAPVSYTIDFGVTNDGLTDMIEINDGWSVGSYGLEPKPYAKFLFQRWIEIMK